MKDEHTYSEKMARIGRNTVIYKGTFVSNQSLNLNSPYFIQPYIELKVKITLADTVLLGDPMYKQNHLMST